MKRPLAGLDEHSLVPEVQTVYWARTSILPAGDPEESRAVVVITADDLTWGTVAVVARSGSDGFGVEHPADPALALSSPGRFSRRHPVQGALWTMANVTPIGRLDDVTFAAVLARFSGGVTDGPPA